jgi:hypothetical protein
MMLRKTMKGGVFAVCAIAVIVLVGCGPRDTRVRNRVTGTVTFSGEPVSAGEILFMPDGEKQNSGPEGLAVIANGRFDTRGTRAPGVDGGPMVVEVNGYLDDQRRKGVTYSFKTELGRSPEMTIDIEIDKKSVNLSDADPIP